MYLLDTNVVSELRKVKAGKADARVSVWASTVAASSLYLASITILELELGILLIERRDPKQGSILRGWMNERVLTAFAGRVVPIDVPVALQCAKLHVPDPRPDRDAMIAAVAIEHGMTIVTRNIVDFEPFGAELLNPWMFEA